jgi:hypothetical protein
MPIFPQEKIILRSPNNSSENIGKLAAVIEDKKAFRFNGLIASFIAGLKNEKDYEGKINGYNFTINRLARFSGRGANLVTNGEIIPAGIGSTIDIQINLSKLISVFTLIGVIVSFPIFIFVMTVFEDSIPQDTISITAMIFALQIPLWLIILHIIFKLESRKVKSFLQALFNAKEITEKLY